MPLSPSTPSISPPVAGPDKSWLQDPQRGAPGQPFQFLENLARDFGDVVCYPSAYAPVWFFNHPEAVRQVLHSTSIVRAPLVTLTLGQGLLSSDGDFWRGQRRLAQPLFHEGCLSAMAPVMTQCIEALVGRWNGALARADGAIELDVAA